MSRWRRKERMFPVEETARAEVLRQNVLGLVKEQGMPEGPGQGERGGGDKVAGRWAEVDLYFTLRVMGIRLKGFDVVRFAF